MKNTIRIITFVSVMLTLLTSTKIAVAQPFPCDSIAVDDWRNLPWGVPTDSMRPFYDSANRPPAFSEFQGCGFQNQDKNISFIHGLGGGVASWGKPRIWTNNNYKTAIATTEYTSAEYEISFFDVSYKIHNDLSTAINNGANNSNPNRCKFDDFAIAHSQGGVAARHLDRYWDLNETTFGGQNGRKYYGLVTFGTPNSGAEIALTQNGHASFIQQVVSAVILNKQNEKIYDFSEKVGYLFGISAQDLLTPIDTLIKNRIAPTFLASVHTETLNEMIPKCSTMNLIMNHNSKLRKVAFYGIENAPECWKLMSNFSDKMAEDYPLWQATPDNDMENKMKTALSEHLINNALSKSKIKSNNNKIKVSVIGLGAIPRIIMVNIWKNQNNELQKNIDHRERAVNFLNNANNQWRYLIGSYHRDSFDIKQRLIYVLKWEEKAKRGHGWVSKEARFDNLNSCHNHMNNLPNVVHQVRNTNITSFTSNQKVMRFFPSDGVVLAKSAIAFPGVGNRIDKMERDNHFQMRNSGETERVLKALYKGDYDTFFYTHPKK